MNNGLYESESPIPGTGNNIGCNALFGLWLCTIGTKWRFYKTVYHLKNLQIKGSRNWTTDLIRHPSPSAIFACVSDKIVILCNRYQGIVAARSSNNQKFDRITHRRLPLNHSLSTPQICIIKLVWGSHWIWKYDKVATAN